MALCDIKNINLTKESIKILGARISYKKLQDDLNFSKTIKKLCNVIKLWHMRTLTLEGTIALLKN